MSLLTIQEGNEQQVIRNLLDNTYSYLEMEEQIKENNSTIHDVVILNQYQDICFFLFYPDRVTVISPYIHICDNKTIFLCCMAEELGSCTSHVCHLLYSEKTNRILYAPKVILINYCNQDKLTVPRLNLSTHSLAAYLRTRTMARIYLIDMQFDLTDKDVLTRINSIHPIVVGLSINYGFFERSITFLDRLYETFRKQNININVILGNIIPAQNYKDYLERYDNMVVSYSEGEQAIKDYIDFICSKKSIGCVSGIYYYDKVHNNIVRNPLRLEDMDMLPFPALDTLLDIKKRRGALSLEFSRGCSHSKCTFCPRDHKGGKWRFMGPTHMFEFTSKLYDICKKEGMSTRFYIADEEFVGRINTSEEDSRIIDYFSLLQHNNIDVTIDVSCRVDSVYDPTMEDVFNARKIEMWRFCSKNGLGRVFLGIESFSNGQLIRYRKGSTCEQNIVAIKILTGLGIDIRLGILLFDQLMTSVKEIQENVYTLGRDDIIEDLSNHKCVPLYMRTSYLLTTMEVLKGSSYLKACENTGVVSFENKNWGKYEVDYINPYIGIMSQYIVNWVGKNYPIVYALKTFLKSSTNEEHKAYSQILEQYKTLNYQLLRYFVQYIDDSGLTAKNVVPFSKYISPSYSGDERIFVNCIEDFFQKTILDAEKFLAVQLLSFSRTINKNSPMGMKLLQLISGYEI